MTRLLKIRENLRFNVRNLFFVKINRDDDDNRSYPREKECIVQTQVKHLLQQ